MAKAATEEKVPVLPRASEVRETIRAVEEGLTLLRGLAIAIGRVERANATAGATEAVPPGTEGAQP